MSANATGSRSAARRHVASRCSTTSAGSEPAQPAYAPRAPAFWSRPDAAASPPTPTRHRRRDRRRVPDQDRARGRSERGSRRSPASGRTPAGPVTHRHRARPRRRPSTRRRGGRVGAAMSTAHRRRNRGAAAAVARDRPARRRSEVPRRRSRPSAQPSAGCLPPQLDASGGAGRAHRVGTAVGTELSAWGRRRA